MTYFQTDAIAVILTGFQWIYLLKVLLGFKKWHKNDKIGVKSFEIQESELRIINDVYGIVGGI